MAATNLILGFGGTGTHVLTFLKEFSVYKHGRKPDELVFLEFDTIADWKPGKTVDVAGGGGAEEKVAVSYEEANALKPQGEYFQLRDRHPSLRDLVTQHLSFAGDRDAFPQYKDWLHSEWLSKVMPPAVLNITAGSAQQRQIGRYAMFANAEPIVAELVKRLRDLGRLSNGGHVNVWIVGSAAGGTGAGCMLDAGYLAKVAAAQANVNITLLAAIVFPDVYGDKQGVSRARAYSLFRELDRIQEHGIQPSDRYARNGDPCSSEVLYDDRGNLRAVVETRLFDYLIYLGRQCQVEDDRVAFFSSVANAIDPYIDDQVGPRMMEELVNRNGLPFTLGGARLTMPVSTYAEIFAWEMVESVIKAAFAPKEDGGLVNAVHWGSSQDRATQARSRMKALLPLFEELLAVADGGVDQVRGFAVNRFDPREVVEKWYQFSSAEAGDRGITQDELDYVVPLVHRNPFISLENAEEDVASKDYIVKTYEERKKTKAAKEDQIASRDRFAQDLKAAAAAYLDAGGGEGSFESGRRIILRTMSAVLAKVIDHSIAEDLAQSAVSVKNDQYDQGTGFTRLYGELRHLVGPEGGLAKTETMLTTVIEALQGHDRYATQSATDALVELERSKPGGMFSFGNWVEDPQRNVRDRYAEMVRCRQNLRLAEDMRTLVGQVRARYEAWLAAVDSVAATCVLNRTDGQPAIRRVRADLHRLHDRLGRMIRDKSTLISLEPGDTNMQGFVDVMRRAALFEQGRDLAASVVETLKWEAGIAEDGRPRIALVVDGTPLSGAALGRLPETLHDRFRPNIDNRLGQFDIFDYLLYVQENHDITPDEIVARLDKAATILLDVNAPQTCRWVYKKPIVANKVNFADALQSRLQKTAGDGLRDPIKNHSDRTSLNLLRAAEPDPARIPNLQSCEEDYIDSFSRNIGHGHANDHEVQRSMIYHGFRAEAEAWFIERAFVREGETNFSRAEELIPPRITRLLAFPDHFQAFVHCLAAGSVKRSPETLGWIWKAPGRDEPIALTRDGVKSEDAFLAAAITFILQQTEARARGRVAIDLKAARDSAHLAAKENHPGRPLHEVAAEFVKPAELEKFFESAWPPALGLDPAELKKHEAELRGMMLAFRFYGRPGAQTALSSRTL